MRSADHHSGVRAHAGRQVRDGGRGKRTRQQDLAAERADARSHGGLEEIARQARVFSDDDSGHVLDALARLVCDRGADAKSHLGRHVAAVGEAANAVGSEEFAAHACFKAPT